MRISSLALIPLASGLTAAVLSLAAPQKVQAEKLPVDCSGRYKDCFERRQCTLYNQDHRCIQRTTDMWYYYYTPTTPPK
jgi:hypothetical protein